MKSYSLQLNTNNEQRNTLVIMPCSLVLDMKETKYEPS